MNHPQILHHPPATGGSADAERRPVVDLDVVARPPLFRFAEPPAAFVFACSRPGVRQEVKRLKAAGAAGAHPRWPQQQAATAAAGGSGRGSQVLTPQGAHPTADRQGAPPRCHLRNRGAASGGPAGSRRDPWPASTPLYAGQRRANAGWLIHLGPGGGQTGHSEVPREAPVEHELRRHARSRWVPILACRFLEMKMPPESA